MDIVAYNRQAWDKEVREGQNVWTIPVTPEQVALARRGEARFLLTPEKTVPAAWYGDVRGRDLLCLASGGGQQGPLFAAMGARVTVFDNSGAQLERDREVAEREKLPLALELGDMKDLSRFADNSFDLIFHPVANCFVDAVRPVWVECFRVLRPGGTLLAGFANPLLFLFDFTEWDHNKRLIAAHPLPFADITHLSPKELEERIAGGQPLEFGHSLEDQIGGQMEAGFLLGALFEDNAGDEVLDRFTPAYIATRAVKPR